MAFADLRDWINDLDERRDLKRIAAQVDWNEEIGAVTREISSQGGPALLFENIKDHKSTVCRRLFTNGTGTRERVCRFIGVPESTSYREMVPIFKERFSHPLKPFNVAKGPVKENILRGDAVDLAAEAVDRPDELGEVRAAPAPLGYETLAKLRTAARDRYQFDFRVFLLKFRQYLFVAADVDRDLAFLFRCDEGPFPFDLPSGLYVGCLRLLARRSARKGKKSPNKNG